MYPVRKMSVESDYLVNTERRNVVCSSQLIPHGKFSTIFDLDGVIVDTVQIHYQSWKVALASYVDISWQTYIREIDGQARSHAVRRILPHASNQLVALISENKQKHFLRLLQHVEINVFESTIRLIDLLLEKGHRCAVVSSSRNCELILEITGLRRKFEVIVSGNNIPADLGKPHPYPFLEAAMQLGVSPDSTIVFEDSIAGVMAARHASMYVVAINRRNTDFKGNSDLEVFDLSDIDEASLLALMQKSKEVQNGTSRKNN